MIKYKCTLCEKHKTDSGKLRYMYIEKVREVKYYYAPGSGQMSKRVSSIFPRKYPICYTCYNEYPKIKGMHFHKELIPEMLLEDPDDMQKL